MILAREYDQVDRADTPGDDKKVEEEYEKRSIWINNLFINWLRALYTFFQTGQTKKNRLQ